MRAVRYYGKEDIRIENIPEQKCGEGMVKIAPAFVGICGTDLHEYQGGPNFAPHDKPHPVTGEVIPITIGHEFSGTVKEIGSGVGGLELNQQVAIQPSVFCGSCWACTHDAENVCPKGGFIGLSGGGGGLSDFVVVPSRAVIPLPSSVPLDIGALVEPLSVAWHAISASPLTSSSTVLVMGGGPIGLAVVECLRARGVGKVIVSEVSAARQAFAKEFGADYVVDPRTNDLVATSRELNNGEGPDIVFDCAGVPASISAACESVRPRGTVVNVAIWEKEVPFQPNMLVFREAKYQAVLGYRRVDFEEVVKALGSGALKPSKMITKRVQLEDVVEGGIKTLIADKDKQVKILVQVAS